MINLIESSEQLLSVGAEWPPKQHQERIMEYQKRLLLLMGKHEEVFKLRSMPESVSVVRILRFLAPWISGGGMNKVQQIHFSLPISAGVSIFFSDLLLGEGLKPAPKEEDRADSQEWKDLLTLLEEQVFFDRLNLEQSIIASAVGDCVYEIGISNGQPFCCLCDPQQYIPIFEFENTNEIREVILGKIYQADKFQFLRAKVFKKTGVETGTFEYQFWLLENSKGNVLSLKHRVQAVQLGLPPIYDQIQQLPKGEIPVVHVPNIALGDCFGIPDLGFNCDSLIEEVDNRFSQNSRILDIHANPLLTGDRRLIDPETGLVQIKGGFVPTFDDGVAPSYITWEAKFEESFTQFKAAVDMISLVTGAPASVLFRMISGEGSGSEFTAKRLRLECFRAIQRVKRKKRYLDPQLKKVLKLLQIYWNKEPIEIGDLGWQDGLPIDDLEEADIQSKRLLSANQSIIGSIMRLDKVDKKAAEEKKKEIDEEAKKKQEEFLDMQANYHEEGFEEENPTDKKEEPKEKPVKS